MMTINRGIVAFLSVVVTLVAFTAALSVGSANTDPVQSGGTFEIKPSVIAGGGGSSSNGTTRIDGTIGQSVLGTSTGGTFSLNGGFWQSQPAGIVNISGHIQYCSAAVPPPVPNSTLNVTGSVSTSTMTDAMGNYSFASANLPASGTYVVTPTKATLAPGPATPQIDTTDVLLARRQFLGGFAPLTPCQLVAAEVTGDAVIDTSDVLAIRRFFLNTAGFVNTGQWKFTPPSNNYVSITTDQANQNYDAVALGDINGDLTPSGPTPQLSTPSAVAQVTLPIASVANTAANQTLFKLPVNVTAISAGDNLVAFQGRLDFDSSVVTFAAVPVEKAGLTGDAINTWTVLGSVTGAGTIKTLNISANVDDTVTPLSGAGVLFNLRLRVVPAAPVGAITALTWEAAGNGFIFKDVNLTSVLPGSTPPGSITIGGTPTAIKLDKCVAKGYDNGVYLEWKTGMDVDNLGFNVYRESAGQKQLITPDVVAGSALLTGKARLQTGRTYRWWDDVKDQQGVQYWLEDIDLNGTRSLHGPFAVGRVVGKPASRSSAEMLSQVGRSAANSAPPRFALKLANTDAQLSKQQEIANGRALKLTVREEGWYSLTRQQLLLAGLDANAAGHNLQLYLQGQEVPMLIAGKNSQTFDAIGFYGTGQDTLSTDAHVYWLVAANSPGKRINVIKGGGKPGGAASFGYTVEKRDRTVYFSSLRNGDQENFFGAVVEPKGVDQKLTLRDVDPQAQAAELEVALQGVTEQTGATPDHSVRVAVNGVSVGTLVFNGREHKSESFSLYQTHLKEGDNIVTLQSEAGPMDVSLVDYVRITYQHNYVAEDNVLKLTAGGQTVKGSPDGVTQTISGFSNSSIRVIDVTDAGSPEEIIGNVERSGAGYQITVNLAGNASRTLLAFTSDRTKQPVNLAANLPSTLRSPNNGADLLMLTRRDLIAPLQPLVALRQRQGLSVAVVDVEDIFDEFNYGERSPQAVRDFLSYAATSWKKKPRFVLMAGDGTFDPKGFLGIPDGDVVATKLIDTQLMETVSDEWFVDFNNDGIGELAIGRLPIRDSGDAALVVGKIVGYERSIPSPEAMLVSDANDGFDFESVSNALRDLIPPELRINQINRGRLDPDTAKKQLLEALNQGQKLVNYIGHGNVDQWKGDLLTNDDARGLVNGQHLSVFVMMTCLNGYYEDPVLSGLAEELMTAQQGGAVAVWASAGLTTPDVQALMNQEFYRQLFGNRGITLGDAIKAAKGAVTDADVRRTWVLLGDPSMRVK